MNSNFIKSNEVLKARYTSPRVKKSFLFGFYNKKMVNLNLGENYNFCNLYEIRVFW